MDAECTFNSQLNDEICTILAISSDRMADSFDDILTSVELWFICRCLSDHMPAAGQNNTILRGKLIIGTQIIALIQHSI
jgi:hypothetical protein